MEPTSAESVEPNRLRKPGRLLDTLEAAAKSCAAPPIRRLSMKPDHLDRYPSRRLWRALKRSLYSSRGHRESRARPAEAAALPAASWRPRARRRRVVLALLVGVQTALAVWAMARTFPDPQLSYLQLLILAIFSPLFASISFSFWAATAGFWQLWRNSKPLSPAPSSEKPGSHASPLSRTAVLVPICNEPVERVFAGVEACYRSLSGTGELDKFDFYLLSDTSDAQARIEEELAWARVCRNVDGFGKIFYRHRRNNIKRKSGNIADFVRRWGRNYEYMIVFDADSIMSGQILVALARRMDRQPQVGLLQTTPTIFNGETLFARVQQFASRLYGPVFTAGLKFWQGGESYYWGHNAILRVKAFVQHCALPRLPGRPPLGGEILSHDFVEAALMGRAGWEIWLVDDLAASYEESPPTILDEFKRDRRWCQGNLQHLRLILGDRIRFGHRAIMAMGIMAYGSSFLWAALLVLVTVQIAVQSLVPPIYFPARESLFPTWPQWNPGIAVALLTTTAALLFVPKFLSALWAMKNRTASGYGGVLALWGSVLVEIAVSIALAPLRMWFHAKYVLLTLLGREIKWSTQRRIGFATGWKEAFRHHGVSTAAALIWTAAVFWLNPSLAGWMLPVTIPLALSIPLSVLTSLSSAGEALRRRRLLLIPEEIARPEVIEELYATLRVRAADERNPGGPACAGDDASTSKAGARRRESLSPPMRAFL